MYNVYEQGDHARYFSNQAYQEHNRRRQEHLASLRLNLANRSVLELGAGIGDHTSFFLSRGCRVTSTDARHECVATIKARYPGISTAVFDLDGPIPPEIVAHDIVYAYGVLYHLSDPAHGIALMASLCNEMLLLETCVSFGAERAVNSLDEDSQDAAQSVRGRGCRPTRPWVFEELQRHFSYTYVTRSQPWHQEFPIDWNTPLQQNSTGLFRAVFVAARKPVESDFLCTELQDQQVRL